MGIYPKIKSENYRNLGGINLKASLYLTNETEFLNLQNVDFRVVGALSSFAGSTQFASQSSTSQITGVADYYQSYFSNPFSGTFSLNTETFSIIATDSYNVCNITGTTFAPLMQYIYGGNQNQVSWVLATNSAPALLAVGQLPITNGALFGANGWDFFTYQGASTAWQFSLGKPVSFGSTITRSGAGGAGLSGFVVMYYSLVRSDGFYGPALSITYTMSGESAVSFPQPSRPDLQIMPAGAGTGLSLGSFGLSGIQAWIQLNQNLPVGLGSLLGLTTSASVAGLTVAYNYTAVGGWTVTSVQPLDFQGSFLYGPGSTQGSDNALVTAAFNPYLVEYYANQLFTAGFGVYPSRVVYSNPGTPEVANYTNFFDVSPNEPVPISGMKSFFTQLVIWKPSSTWALSGTGPDTFVLTNISPIYGLISSKASCVWNQQCWFLDRKGICQFDGASVAAISNKMQPFFERMNVAAAVTQAIMIHVKERNEVWCAIPIDGSATNNIIIIYDYLANAWSTRTCPPGTLTVLNTLTLGNNKQTPYYGTASGMIGTFGNSLIGDNGQAFTSVIKSRFVDDLGQTVTKLYRRLYVDASVQPGQTFVLAVNLYSDKATGPALSTTMVLTTFQSRMDFGIAAKSISAEFIYSGATFLQINGYTIEYRFQRNV